MESKIAALTVFTFFLVAGATARIAVDPTTSTPSVAWNDEAFRLIKTSLESIATADSNILLPVENAKSDSDEANADSNVLIPLEKAKSDSDETAADDLLPKPEKTTVDIPPRTDLTRFHTINRHFFMKPRNSNQIVTQRRPCLKSVRPNRTPITKGNDEISSGKSNPEPLRGQVPSNGLKVKQDYSSSRHRGNDGVSSKHMFDKETLKSSIREQKQKKREEEASLMRRIRKFLKHTFD